MSQPRNVRKSETSQTGRIKDGGQVLSPRRWRKQKREMRVLAERNPAVVPVGAWVETGHEEQEHPAVRALLTEELLEETRRLKEESLRQFQEAVRRRVSEQARIHKQRQLQKSYKTVERECRVFQQSSVSAHRLTPPKSPFPSWPQGELAICSPSARWVTAQELKVASSDDANQYRHQLSKVMKQVRHRLAACQTVQEGEDLELPGGIWKVSPNRDKTVGRIMEDEEEENEDGLGEEEEVLLAGQHDRPLCSQNSKTVTFQNDVVCERVSREPHPTSPDYRSTRVLWPREDPEEQMRQRRSQFLMYRRLVMDSEREQVKEHQRRKKHLTRIASSQLGGKGSRTITASLFALHNSPQKLLSRPFRSATFRHQRSETVVEVLSVRGRSDSYVSYALCLTDSFHNGNNLCEHDRKNQIK
ncbi:coiled-coil domain-containing protein 15 isoform X4 [Ictalurus furcatus]|uniref:coiled-coil domain-containing protein 15 isoform X4 n=1 Tax=Ictalurus furcatus TaxID=66913 RepID=UPI0023510468|nr:coiled-coil domain-containing protein 15 isoform X4 [Ictalurus furcatus]